MSEGTGKTEVTEKGLAAYRLPIKGLILGIIGMLLAVWIIKIIGPVSGFLPTAETSLMFIILIALITSFLPPKLRLSMEDYVVIFAMIYAAPAVSDGSLFFSLPIWIHTDVYSWLNSMKAQGLVPSWVFGPKELYDLALKGGVSPPWGQLTPWILTGFVVTIAYALAYMLAAAAFRRQVIEVERIVFPVATATYTSVISAYAVGEEAKAPLLGTKRNWMIVGLLVGFLLTAFTEGYLVSRVAPWLPVIPGTTDLSPQLWKAVPGLMLDMYWNSFFPWSFFGFFFPMESLIGISIGAIVTYMILLPLEIRMGLIPSFDMSMSKEDVWFYAFRVEGFKFFFGAVAMINAVVIAYYITGLKSLRETWKENPEDAFGRYRTTAILAIVGILVFLAVGVIFGGFLPAIFLIALDILFLANMFWIRGIGECNLMWSVWAVYFMDALQICEVMGVVQRGVGEVTPMLVGTYAPMMLALETSSMAGVAYMETSRFAFLAKVSPKKVAAALIVGFIIAYFIESIISAQLTFQFGIRHDYFGAWGYGYYIFFYPYRAIHQVDVIEAWYSLSGAAIPFYAFCFILGFALTFARYRWAIPISAIGLAFGMGLDPWSFGYTFIPYLVIKWLMLKLGGTKLVEQVGAPFFAGASAGGMLAAFFAGIAAYYQAIYGG
ncbi:MAG: hypothetical protein DRN04_04450 [Thermoprotei archaeon]|nr:MAG: hypothetical protein DRN04_04450 [Thermoprotei archaeon]